jgi:hypothetical protein
MPYFADLKRTIREAQQRARGKIRDIGIGAKKPVSLLDAAE